MLPSGSLVEVEAEPEPFTLDPLSTAIIVVDMQNDFGSEGGMFHRAGIDIAPIRATLAPIAGVLSAARHAGIPVVYLKMEFRADLSDAGAARSPNRVKHALLGLGERMAAPGDRDGAILVRDTWNTDIVEELTPEAGDIVVSKHRYSGFFETDLEVVLRSLGIETLVVTGATTSVCVESTVRDAMFRDYRCLVLSDCVAEPIGAGTPRSNHEASLLVLQLLFAWTSTSQAFLASLAKRGRGCAP